MAHFFGALFGEICAKRQKNASDGKNEFNEKSLDLFHRGIIALGIQRDGIFVLPILALRVAHIALGIRVQRTGTVNGVTVLLHPLPYLAHPLQGGGRQLSVGIGTDIEQEIAALRYYIY